MLLRDLAGLELRLVATHPDPLNRATRIEQAIAGLDQDLSGLSIDQARYFDQLDGTAPNDLYQLVIQQVEQPLFEAILNHTGGNQSKAATLLGISRSTLRKKIAQYEIE